MRYNDNSLVIPWYIFNNNSLTSSSKMLLAIIENDTWYMEFCTKTLKELAQSLGMSSLAITRALRKMHNDGLITMHESLSIKNRLQYKYTINKDKAVDAGVL